MNLLVWSTNAQRPATNNNMSSVLICVDITNGQYEVKYGNGLGKFLPQNTLTEVCSKGQGQEVIYEADIQRPA